MVRQLAALGVLIALAAPSDAVAQVTDDDVGSNASMAILFPQLRTMPAPAFLRPGVRVSYATGSATGNGGPAGGGIVQYDVVTVDGGQALAYLHSYNDDGNGFAPLATGMGRGYPALGPFWINPAVLANAESVASATLSVTRVNKTLGDGTTLAVVRFQTNTQNGRLATEFDTATGVMVFDSISSGPSASQQVLLGVRGLTLPWQLGRAPNWVRPGATVAYAGTKTTNISGSIVTQQLGFGMQIAQAGARWSLATVSQTLDGQQIGAGVVPTGQAQLVGALWLPVSALTVPLDPNGTLIDRDAFTGAELYLGRAENGGAIVQQITARARLTATYSPTLGVLDRSTREQQDLVTQVIDDVSRMGGDAPLTQLAQQAPLPEDPGAAGAAGGGGGGGGGCATGGAALPAPWVLAMALLWCVRRRLRRVIT